MGTLSVSKGKIGERELARLLADELGVEVVRNLVQSREGGCDLLGVPFFSVEVKRAQRVTRSLLMAWWGQCEIQAEGAGLKPALAYREDRGDWRVAIRLYDLVRIGPPPGREHAGTRPIPDFPSPADMRPDPGGAERRWPGWTWTATLSVPAFACVVREGMGPSTPPPTAVG